jgi:hypothetical protein
MRKRVFAAAGLAGLIGAGTALAGQPCLRMDLIDGWGTHDAHAVVINDRFGRRYLVSVTGWCRDIEYGFGLSVHNFGDMPMSCVERGDWVVSHGGGVDHVPGVRCFITKVEPYTPEMEKAFREQKDAARKAKAAPPPPPAP